MISAMSFGRVARWPFMSGNQLSGVESFVLNTLFVKSYVSFV